MTTLGIFSLGYVELIEQHVYLLIIQGDRVSRPNYFEQYSYGSSKRHAAHSANIRRLGSHYAVGLCKPGTVPSLFRYYEAGHMCFLPAYISRSR